MNGTFAIAPALPRRTLLRRAGQLGAAGAFGMGWTGTARAANNGLVVLVHTQAAGDNGPIDDMIASLRTLAAERKFQARAIYAPDPASFESLLRSLAEAGTEVVITTFFPIAQAVAEVAPKFPKTRFIEIYANKLPAPLPNVRTIQYDGYYGMYLSGLFAAKVSRSGLLGYIGGVDLPGLKADLNALKAGAASANAAVKVDGAFAGSFEDPARGRKIAGRMFAGGIDFIQADAAATDTGVIQAANDGPERMVSGVFRSQFRLGPKTVIGGVLIAFGTSLYQQLTQVLDGRFESGHHVSNLDDGVVDFVLSDLFLAQGPAELVARAKAHWPEIAKAKQAIIDGSLKVPFETTL